MGWETFKRIENKNGVPDGVPFQRCGPKAQLTAFLLEPDSKAPTHPQTAGGTCAPGGSNVHAEVQRRRDRGSMRWGSTSLSVTRSASFSTVPSAVQMAIGDAHALKNSAPLIVSSFKQAANEWDAASAATADPFTYINAKVERLTASPTARLPTESSNVDAHAVNGALEEAGDTVCALGMLSLIFRDLETAGFTQRI